MLTEDSAGRPTSSVKLRVVDPPLESATCSVKVKVPSAVGVPAIALLAGSSTSPGGSDPVFTVQTYGGTPPVALRLRLHDEPAGASGSGDAVVIATLDVTARVNCLVATAELLSVTCAANAKLPPSVGTPQMVAVPASKESPAGSPPEAMLQSDGRGPAVAT